MSRNSKSLETAFSSRSEDWGTPQKLFDELNAEFHFTLDVCASEDNKKCGNYFNKEQDALQQEWTGICYMNPPYGKTIKSWMKKAYESSLAGATVVCLIPSRTDTRWFHDYAMKAEDIRFIKGRLRYTGIANNVAPFPSLVIVFHARNVREENNQ